MEPDPAALQQLAPHVSPRLISEHLARLDATYFDRFDAATIAEHLRRLDGLSPLLPADAIVSRQDDGQVECTILGFDAPGLFSLATGILMSLGFSILSGDVYTYGPAVRRRMTPHTRRAPDAYRRRRIVDYFVGRVQTELAMEQWAAELRRRLSGTLALVERSGAEGLHEARQRVNDWVTQRLQQAGPARPRSPFETHVRFEPGADGGPRLSVESEDTPAFLYSLSAALALHDVSIKRVRIRTVEGRIHDELEVELPAGANARELEEQIRTAVLLTKQFTYFLDSAADPYTALTRFDWLATHAAAERAGSGSLGLLADPRAMPYLARLLGASDFLWEDFIRPRYAEALAALKSRLEGQGTFETGLKERLDGAAPERRRAELAAYRERQAFLLELDGILDPAGDPRPLSRRLTALAEELLQASLDVLIEELGGSPPAPFALFGLGKFGAGALGYASDLELLLVYDGSQASPFFARLLEELQSLFRGKQEGLFELDLRLRPWGKNAPLECPLATFETYYGPGGEAHSLERLALTRLRAVAGDAAFGRRVQRLRDTLIYERPWLDLDELAEVRGRQFRQKRAGARNAKYSPGGLVDVEYGVQVLQVRHGRTAPALRTPDLEAAIGELGRRGVVTASEAERLRAADLFLRRLINALRVLRGVAEDLVLPAPDSADAQHLARRMGYSAPDWKIAAEDLEREFADHTAFVRDFVRRCVGEEMLPSRRDLAAAGDRL